MEGFIKTRVSLFNFGGSVFTATNCALEERLKWAKFQVCIQKFGAKIVVEMSRHKQ